MCLRLIPHCSILSLWVKKMPKRKKPELPEQEETVLCSTHMDDTMDATSKAPKPSRFIKIFGKSWLYARKWISNSVSVIKQIPEEDRALDINLRNEEFPSIKTLGSMWKAKLSFLKKLATIFDPFAELAIICSKLTIKTLEQGVKYLQS